MSEPSRDPAVARAFDAVVIAAGAVAMVVSVLQARPWQGFPWALLAVVPVVAVMARYPLELLRRNGGIEIGLDCIVLVFLAMVATQAQAASVWAVATVLVQLTVPKSWSTRLFNTGLCIVAGTAALASMWLVGPLGVTGKRELLALAVGCGVYFVVDFLITGLSIALLTGDRLATVLLDRTLPLTLACFLAVDTLGWLAGLTLRTAPFGLPLLAAPVVALVFAVRSFAQAHNDRARLRLLFLTAVEVQAATTPREVEQILAARAAELLRAPSAELRARPPEGQELGARMGAPDGQEGRRWLVVAPRLDDYEDVDTATLNTLAALAGESVHRARLGALTEHMARHDPLTGLANRAVLRERLEHAIELRRRDGMPLAVVYADLDGFKAVNDTMGHEAGDELLVLLADRLRDGVRPGDTIARLGGDEFAVLLESVAGAQTVEYVAQRMLEAISAPLQLRGRTVAVAASVGYAVRTGAEDASELLRNADVAMYHVKASGKNAVAGFVPAMLETRVARVELERELRGAVDSGQLCLEYQPVIDLASGAVDGIEALVRWQHPTRGLLGPKDFITVAEETGLVDGIGLWVIQEAWTQALRLNAAFGRQLTLAVNVAPSQLRTPALEDTVARLAAAGGPQLVLEVTERGLVAEPATIQTLARLRALGARVAVDDFGTGYSSFAYLRTLPVDIIKLDRQFVVDAADDPRAAGIVRAVGAMAATLDLVTVAEGVETPEQREAVLAAGCGLAQGYLFARPMSAEALTSWLLDRRETVAPAVSGGGPRR